MPVHLPRPQQPGEYPVVPSFGGPANPAAWAGERPQAQSWSEPAGIPWARYFDVIKRHIVLIAALTAVGSAVGLVAGKRVKPAYEAETTIWVNAANGQQSGPFRAQQLLPTASWVELLRSYAIVDEVVRRLNLNLSYKQRADSVLFRNFGSGVSVHPGTYTLKVDSRGQQFVLSRADGVALEHGIVGDTIGVKEGFSWIPEVQLLRAGRLVEFSVATPRGAAMALVGAVRATLPENGQFLRIALSGSDPQRTARTLNAWAEQFVASSIDLKKRHLLQFKQTLAEQLGVAEGQLHGAESELEAFRVNTITLPSTPTPVARAAPATPAPVTGDYFQQKATLDDIRSDRLALERIMADAKGGAINPQAFLMLPSILYNTPQLRTAIEELSSRQAALRTEQQYLTDANPRIKQLAEGVHVLEQETIPRITLSVLASLRAREPELNTRIDEESRELRAIPSRSTEEMRLVRRLAASENLYNTLKARYEEVSLSDAETAPDLSVLDLAVPPLFPTSNDTPRLLLLAVLASIGLSVGIALLHDRFDRRFRYPEHATHDLGLTIAGTVPKFKANRHGDFGIETMSAAVESFRSLRLALTYDFPGNAPIVLGVSSPAVGDGKSLVSSNLALAFASTGSRTLLIDGDVRRGNLHTTFDVPVTPGLVEHLNGFASMESILNSTSSDNLFVIPRGTRRNRAPELLVSGVMSRLVLAVRERFDVVIIDSPPFVAGMDAYALGAAAGSMLIVLRPAVTDRKLAAAKLEVLDRLPIRILGAVVNAVPAGGSYEYYGSDYTDGGHHGSDPDADLATPGGLVLRA
jgi:polysaccharide biosynthesis transport protein